MTDSDVESGQAPQLAKKKAVKILFDACVCDPVRIEFNIYKRYIQGFSEKEATKKEYPNDADKRHLSTVRDQYRTFKMLEEYMHSPHSLANQLDIQLNPAFTKQLVELYYSLIDDVLKDVIGRKLYSHTAESSKETSDKSAVWKRQYENIRLAYRILYNTTNHHHHNPIDELQKKLMLSEELSKRYVYIAFMCYHRFEISKKRLNYLNYSHYELMTATLVHNWLECNSPSYVASTPKHRHSRMDKCCLELDPNLVELMRDAKPMLLASRKDETIDLYLQLIINELRKKPGFDSDKLKKIKSKFIGFAKAILVIAGNLSQSKEFRDFFIDLDRAADFLREKHIEPADLEVLFSAMQTTFPTLLDRLEGKLRHKSKLIENWERFVQVLGKCIICVVKASK